MIRSLLLLFSLVFISISSTAQIGGMAVYKFLDISYSPRQAALGTSVLSINDGDLTLGLTNPSLITDEFHNDIAFNFIDYFAGVNVGSAHYSRKFDKAGNFMASMQYVNYGQMDRTDDIGSILGKFTASDMALTIGWGRALTPYLNIGSNFKMIYSNIEHYTSFGLGVDLAATLHSENNYNSLSLVLKNMGLEVVSYVPYAERQAIPFNIQLAASRRLEHVPIRLSIVLDQLNKWDLTYIDPTNPLVEVDPFTGEVIEPSSISSILDKAMRHVIIGAEFSPSKNFSARIGYNYRRRQELKVNSKPGGVGLSWGFGIKISKFKIDFGHASYHLAGATNHIGITTSFSEFMK